MKTHDMQPYALFNKKFCSFALYEGKDGKDFLAYQKSSRFSPREQDKRFIAGLRKWLHSFQLNEGMLENMPYQQTRVTQKIRQKNSLYRSLFYRSHYIHVLNFRSLF